MRMRSSAFSISRHRVGIVAAGGAATAALTLLGGCAAAHQGQHAGGQRHITAARAGKPWGKISLASLPNGTSLRKLFARTQTGNPLTAMGNPTALAKFLAAARHVRVVRDQSVDGVVTTKYSGVIDLRSFATAMPSADRKFFGSLGPADIKFWIDHQHQMRKMVMRLAFGKASIALTANVTSINQPVRIVAPPASQVSAISHP